MVKNGILKHQHVLVNKATDGMDNIAKNHMFALTAEYGIQLINNVFALKVHIGADLTV